MSGGVEVFTKTCESPEVAAWEHAGLDWLAAATATGGAPVVPVLAREGRQLSLARVREVPPTACAARAFGAALAHTHTWEGANGFGVGPGGGDKADAPGSPWRGHGFQGPALQVVPLPLAAPGEYPAWGAMYANLRVAPLVRQATSAFSAKDRAVFGRLVQRLRDGHFDDDSPPARIHGDLWSGNVLWAASGAMLIDPAAQTGHRESDLANLAVFGAPFFDEIVAGYETVFPLEPGWRERMGLHQLHMILLHVVLCGGGYAQQALRIARRYG